ncbi:phage tail protein [Plesiomonas shigelloides]|nr:phage tail protein [Plesiomonas shigelloides]
MGWVILTCIQDRPADPVWMYTEANVVDGRFTYQSSARKARHTAVHVQYVSPDNGWQTQIEYVADDEAIARYGLNVLEVSAFGCTSRGQAHRTGKWILETERLERQSVSFSVGRDGLKHLPGDIIQIADSGYAGIRIGGRIKAVVGQNVQLDREVGLPGIDSGATAYLTWIGADAKPIRAQIFSQPAADTVVLGMCQPVCVPVISGRFRVTIYALGCFAASKSRKRKQIPRHNSKLRQYSTNRTKRR